MKSIQEALQWRYAVKKMSGEPVSEEKVQQIIDAAYMAPTSSGLMPFKIFVVKNAELKEKIFPIAYNQSQIMDASHLLIFASWDELTPERIESAFDYMNAQRGLPDAATRDYVENLKSVYASFPKDAHAAAAGKQSYISFGFALMTAAMLGVDTTPMEGFNSQALDELLDLGSMGLKSQTILAIGHRDAENDWLLPLKKVRPAKEDVIVEL